MDKQKAVNKVSPQNKKNDNTAAVALGAGAAVASVVGASVGSVLIYDHAIANDDVDELFAELVPDIDNTGDADVISHHSSSHVHHHVGSNVTVIEDGSIGGSNVAVDPSGLANNDQIDPGADSSLEPVGWQYITDADGNRMRVMVFQDGHGNNVAFAESSPGSGIYDTYIDPRTGAVGDNIYDGFAYSVGDFEDMLHDDGGYLAPRPDDYHYAYNDDIRNDIINTDNGELIAVADRPSSGGMMGGGMRNPNIVTAGIDEEIEVNGILSEEDDELVAQMLGDDDDVNNNNVEIVDDNDNQDVAIVQEISGVSVVEEEANPVVGHTHVAYESHHGHESHDFDQAPEMHEAPAEVHDPAHDFADAAMGMEVDHSAAFSVDDAPIDA